MSAALDELRLRASALPREERVRLVKLLADDLAHEVPANSVGASPIAEFWSPHDAYDAAAILLRVLHGSPTE